MAKCVVCNVEKDNCEFNWRNKPMQIRKNYCRACDSVIRKRNYANNRQKQINESVARSKALKAQFRAWKETLSCLICGEAEEACIDFHHVDGDDKEQAISILLTRGSKQKIVNELNKCVPICACCHRKVHKYGWVQVAGEVPLLPLEVKASLVFNGQHSVLPSRS